MIKTFFIFFFHFSAFAASVSLETGEHGQYFFYKPNNADKLIIIAHGSVNKKYPALSEARKYIKRWTKFAREHSAVLISPVFSRKDYQTYGGYRGLFGRHIGADKFIIDLAEKKGFKKFYLYGHSAGGQFAIRFYIRHSQRLLAAIASAPGRYAFPSLSAAWPYGMAPLKMVHHYKNPDFKKPVSVLPDPQSWTRAGRIPLRIIVGSNDLEEQPRRPAHVGRNRIELAKNWLLEMKKLNNEAKIKVKIVDGIGHSSKRLTPKAQAELVNLF